METKHVVLSLVVKDLEASLKFYKQVFELTELSINQGTIMLDLPGMLLFLANEESFTKYAKLANVTPYYPKNSIESFLSCSIETREEVDEILEKAKTVGGQSFAPEIIDHINGLKQYIGVFRDPDGHVWQLVCNIAKV